MKTSSAKAKGHRLEAVVRDKLIEAFALDPDTIRIPVSSEKGSDLKIAQKVLKQLPIKVECKNRAKIAIYGWYDQCCNHHGELHPVLVVKANRRLPLAVIDLRWFLELLKHKYNKE